MSNAGTTGPKKLLFLVTEDWYFCSHRLPIARHALKCGFEVVVATHVQKHGEQINAEGFRLIPISMRRSGVTLFGELTSLIELIRLYRREKPDIIHHVAMKPAVFGSIAALFSTATLVVNAVNGLGTLFSSTDKKTAVLRFIIKNLLRFLFNRSNSHLIVQNPDDYKSLANIAALADKQISLIAGSGVDIAHFTVLPPPKNGNVVALVSRMLQEKGVEDLIEATNILRAEGLDVSLILAGRTDKDSATSIPEEQLYEWSKSEYIEWVGIAKDVRKIWAKASIAVLPSYYREGVPKALLEAAACGRPIITTDMPGCRDVVQQGKNGLLVPVKNPAILAQTIKKLLEDPNQRDNMATAGRKRVESMFSEEIIVKQTIDIYIKASKNS
ncbi:MAG: glycosyltransferase family 4 protein [Magnetococcales bacterium]|nr:glycosyltransferase family 4 protein [Magnetococcales bacterium]